MISMDQLYDMKAAEFNTCDKNALKDISSIAVDGSIEKNERVLRYIETVGNPYMFRVGDMAVRVKFGERQLRQTMAQLLSER